MSIRAVIEGGQVRPLEPLPAAWADGRELRIDAADPDPGDIDAWARDLDDRAARLDDPREWERIEAALSAAETLAKDQVRREMGRP